MERNEKPIAYNQNVSACSRKTNKHSQTEHYHSASQVEDILFDHISPALIIARSWPEHQTAYVEAYLLRVT